MVTDFRILRGSHRAVCLCRPGAHRLMFFPAFIARAQLAGQRVRTRLRVRLTVAFAARESIYDEAIIWGLALSLGAIFFAFRSRQAEGSALTGALLGFSFCAGGALLSRVTFGAPFILIAPFLALRLPRSNRFTNLTTLVLPLGVALIFYIWLSYAKFGSLTGVNYDYYINSVHAEFAHKFGVFSPRRVLHSFADYFSVRFPSLEREPPFLAADRHFYDYPSLYSNDFSEVYLPLLWCSPWLIFGAIMGIICLVRRDGADAFERGAAAALFAQFLCILSFFALAQRYAADLYPFLSPFGRAGLSPVTPCDNRTRRSLDRRELACNCFLVDRS